jgi:hypothetical protein
MPAVPVANHVFVLVSSLFLQAHVAPCLSFCRSWLVPSLLRFFQPLCITRTDKGRDIAREILRVSAVASLVCCFHKPVSGTLKTSASIITSPSPFRALKFLVNCEQCPVITYASICSRNRPLARQKLGPVIYPFPLTTAAATSRSQQPTTSSTLPEPATYVVVQSVICESSSVHGPQLSLWERKCFVSQDVTRSPCPGSWSDLPSVTH